MCFITNQITHIKISTRHYTTGQSRTILRKHGRSPGVSLAFVFNQHILVDPIHNIPKIGSGCQTHKSKGKQAYRLLHRSRGNRTLSTDNWRCPAEGHINSIPWSTIRPSLDVVCPRICMCLHWVIYDPLCIQNVDSRGHPMACWFDIHTFIIHMQISRVSTDVERPWNRRLTISEEEWPQRLLCVI